MRSAVRSFPHLVCGVLLFLINCVPTVAQTRYTITDLGTLTGNAADYSYGYSVNASGHVVGEALAANGTNSTHPFFWMPAGSLVDLWPNGVAGGSAVGINDGDQVAGSISYGAAGLLHVQAVRWSQSGAMTILDSINGFDASAVGINKAGQVVGSAWVDATHSHAVTWTGTAVTDLDPLAGDGTSQGNAINSQGHVVGTRNGAGFLWSAQNGIVSLPAISGSNAGALAVNDGDIAVGYSSASHNGSDINTACQWINGVATGLWPLGADNFSQAYGINNSGLVVGVSRDVNLRSKAVIWENSVAVDLNTRLDNGAGWILLVAHGVNDARQIIGYGTINGQGGHAFLLTPTNYKILQASDFSIRDPHGNPVVGIVCDNLARMPDAIKDCLKISTATLVGATNLTVSITNDDGSATDSKGITNVGSSTVGADAITYYPPDEFNVVQEPSGIAEVWQRATRTVYLKLSFVGKNGNTYFVDHMPIILARPPVVLVHGINSAPSAWNPFITAIDGMDADGNEGSSIDTSVPIASTPLVAMNHSTPKSFRNGLDNGNAPVEIGALMLAERIQKTIDAVQRGTSITDDDENSWNANPKYEEQHRFDGYLNMHLAIQRVDVVAWSYGGVITRWYLNQPKPSDSRGWYNYTFRYTRRVGGASVVYNNANLPDVPYKGDVRKVITLGSMWRGVPVINYGNEAIYGGTEFGLAPVITPFTTIHTGHLFDWFTAFDALGKATGSPRFLVPSMEVMAIESNWMKQLVFGSTISGISSGPVASPFQPQVAYGSVAGTDHKYPIAPLVKLNVYADLVTFQQPSWFPYLTLEQGEDYTDGLVPLWSAAIPGSYKRAHVSHGAFMSDADVQQYVVQWLNHAGLPNGEALTAIWNNPASWNNAETAVETADGNLRFRFLQGYMAPYPQNEIYLRKGSEGGINPSVLGSRGRTYPKLFKESLHVNAYLSRDGGDVIANITFSNVSSNPSENVPIYNLVMTGVSITPHSGGIIQRDANLVALETLRVGSTKSVSVRFTNISATLGQKFTLNVSYTYAASSGTENTPLELRVLQ